MSPSGTRQRPDEKRRQSVKTRSGNRGASEATKSDSFIVIIQVAQRQVCAMKT